MANLLLHCISCWRQFGREGELATSANPFNFTPLWPFLRPSAFLPPRPTCDMLQSIRSSAADSTTLAAADHFFTFNAPISSKGGRTDDPFLLLPPRSLPLWRNGQASGLFLSGLPSERKSHDKRQKALSAA